MARTRRKFACTGCGAKIPLTVEEYDGLLDRLRRGFVLYCETCRQDPRRLPPWDARSDDEGYVYWPAQAEILSRQRVSLLARLGLRLLLAVLGLGYGLLYPFWWLVTIPLRAYADARIAWASRTGLEGSALSTLIFSVFLFFFGIVLRVVVWPLLTVLTWVALPMGLLYILAGGWEAEQTGVWHRLSGRFG